MIGALRAGLAALALAAMTPGAPGWAGPWRALDFAQLQGWADEDHAAARRVFAATCDLAGAGGRGDGAPGVALSPEDWRAACAAARDPAIEARRFFETFFVPVLVSPPEGGLLTGYFEPELHGALRPDARFRHPLHAAPDDPALRRLTRAQIRAGALRGRGLELVWLDDPVAAYFLHVQGSGRVRLTDGRVLRLGFAGRNAHPYRSLGRALVEAGAFAPGRLSAQRLRAWLSEDPERLRWLDVNPSYIFFREIAELDPDDGPIGAMGRPLHAGRSAAVDPAFAPLGAPLWVEAPGAPPLRRLFVAQDVGAAIKGPGRVDLFFGAGEEAFEKASAMHGRGRVAVLLPVSAARRLALAR
ncbi:murein transglycosylase A [Oceanicella actignis]|uniref:murein transglycosylase A n=1 Tax=Oceanicella actignis TaxID=1189325 RepID=UPI0011E6E2BB|nr:MltA domain-containing protein [Oceanicella actignis]TYO88887.1 membrane-bound lytic murein transglycosylase A [Oceanicella actignis]